ncbi:MAG: M36 family metallopeptidase [Niastella sp.]|nr:M36 family metallopeptidase [Niastella sp.]
MKKLKAKVEKHPERKVPRRIYDIQSKSSKKKPEAIAVSTLKKIAPELKIKADLSQLKFDQVKESILGKHVLYQQQFQGKPISGAWIRVDIDKEGKVYNIQNDLVPEPVLKKSESLQAKKNKSFAADTAGPQITAEDAKALAIEAVKPSTATADMIADTELVFYPHNGIPVLAWKIIIMAAKPRAEFKIYFDAISGAIIEKINLLKFADGVGQVFDPNPVVTLNDTDLDDTSVVPAKAYKKVVLKDLKAGGQLDGPFVNTSTTRNRVKRSDLSFLFKREDRAFKEVMVYFHIDTIQRYIQSLGFTNVLNRSIAADIDGTTDDNSFYSPVTKSLTFGTGGVDDAEDADIILHEYGHAIQDNQVPGFGATHQGEAMGEGFGDYLAASFFSDKKTAALKPTIGNWDCVASAQNPPCLRRLDSNKKFPKDMTQEVHDDGEIWSACLWQMRGLLGRTITDKLVIAHHFLLTPKSGFEDAANALITTDQNLNQGKNKETIRKIFIERGILTNPAKKNKRAGAPFNE